MAKIPLMDGTFRVIEHLTVLPSVLRTPARPAVSIALFVLLLIALCAVVTYVLTLPV